MPMRRRISFSFPKMHVGGTLPPRHIHLRLARSSMKRCVPSKQTTKISKMCCRKITQAPTSISAYSGRSSISLPIWTWRVRRIRRISSDAPTNTVSHSSLHTRERRAVSSTHLRALSRPLLPFCAPSQIVVYTTPAVAPVGCSCKVQNSLRRTADSAAQ